MPIDPVVRARRAMLAAALVALSAASPGATRARAPEPVAAHTLVAQAGGSIPVMRHAADVVWMGHGPRVAALDIATPGAPRLAGRTPLLPGSVRDLAVAGAAPNAAGGAPGVLWALASGGALVGVDVRDAERPRLLGRADAPAGTAAIALVGDHLWAVTQAGAVTGYDVGDPSAPREAGRLAGLDRASRVSAVAALGGHLAVVTSGYPDLPVLHLVDVRDPQRPLAVGALEHPGPDGWVARAAAVDGGRVWLLGSSPDQLLGVDVADPARPALAARIDGDDFASYEAFYIPQWFTVRGGRAYLWGGDGGHNYFRLSAIDVADAAKPVLVGSIDLPRTSDPAGGFVLAGGRLWYSTRDGHLFGLDVGDPAGGAAVAADLRFLASGGALTVAGDLGLLDVGEAVMTLDLARPGAPRALATALTHHYPEAMAVLGDTALVVTGGEMDVFGGELHALDVAAPAAPQRVASLLREHDPTRLAVTGTLGAMIATRESFQYRDHAVVLIDAARPAAPRPAGWLESAGGFQDVAWAGDVLVAAGPARYGREPAAVRIVTADASDPARPAVRGSVELAAAAHNPIVRVAAEGDTVYVVAHGRGEDYGQVVGSALHVVDVGDPDAPSLRSTVPLAAAPSAVAAAHGHALVAVGAGVAVFDVRDPARPVERGVLPTGADAAVDVAVAGPLVYATAGGGGLYVFHPELDGWPDFAWQPLPDLVGHAYGRCYRPGIEAEVSNRGAVDAGPFVIRDTDGVLVRAVEGLAAGGSETFEVTGDFRWPARVDADDDVAESNEDNNTMWLAVPGCGLQVVLPWLGAGR